MVAEKHAGKCDLEYQHLHVESQLKPLNFFVASYHGSDEVALVGFLGTGSFFQHLHAKYWTVKFCSRRVALTLASMSRCRSPPQVLHGIFQGVP